MERRLYFVIGDVVSNTGVGAAVALAVTLFVDESWPMPLAMVAGMVASDVVALPAAVGLSILFGAMEVMLPVMLSGILAGMVAGMRAASGPVPPGSAAALGAAIGLLALVAAYGLNGYVQAQHRREEARR